MFFLCAVPVFLAMIVVSIGSGSACGEDRGRMNKTHNFCVTARAKFGKIIGHWKSNGTKIE